MLAQPTIPPAQFPKSQRDDACVHQAFLYPLEMQLGKRMISVGLLI